MKSSCHASTKEAQTFTPGPWEWDCGVIPPDGPGRYADIYVDGGDKIIASFNDCIPEGKANARLIAAAPDLLEALLFALLCIDDEVNIYAPEMCDAKRVEEARARHAIGGTLHYYATAISKARAAIAKCGQANSNNTKGD